MSLLSKLKEAFPDKVNERVVYTAFEIATKAIIYVDHANPRIAKIRTSCLANFPNGKELENYVNRNNIKTIESKSHPDVIIGIEHVDQIIKIIKK